MTIKEAQPVTAVWRNGGCSASYDSFVVDSSSVLRLNFCAKNPPLRQAAKRYAQCRGTDFGASKIGTFACRTFPRDTKASKRAN